MTVLDPERRSRLLGVKLAALARDHLSLSGAPAPFPGGSALTDGARGAVLVEDDAARALGPAVAWSRRHDVAELHLLVEDAAGALARRAACFSDAPTVWWVRGRDLHAVEAEPHALMPQPSAGALAFVATLEAAGCRVRVEHGVVTGEVLGLEVARVVEPADAPTRLEVGIGRHDREAFAIIHGDLPPEAALVDVVAAVARQRRADAPEHALHRLAAERWLREIVLHDPARVGAARLDPVAGAGARPNVKDAWPAFAAGVDGAGAPVVAVCSVGVDLDLVPEAADARLLHASDEARLVLVLPERDALPITRELTGALRHPAEILTVADDWRTLPA